MNFWVGRKPFFRKLNWWGTHQILTFLSMFQFRVGWFVSNYNREKSVCKLPCRNVKFWFKTFEQVCLNICSEYILTFFIKQYNKVMGEWARGTHVRSEPWFLQVGFFCFVNRKRNKCIDNMFWWQVYYNMFVMFWFKMLPLTFSRISHTRAPTERFGFLILSTTLSASSVPPFQGLRNFNRSSSGKHFVRFLYTYLRSTQF